MITHLTENKHWFPLSRPASIHRFLIDNDEVMEAMIKVIDDKGDEELHTTNLKCNMTEYRSWEKDDRFDKLLPIIDEIINRTPVDIKLSDMWGAVYESEEYAREHDHGNAEWSFCLYLNEGEGFPPLIVDGNEVEPKKGLMVVFPGWVRHEVKSKKFEGHRYVVAGNLIRNK